MRNFPGKKTIQHLFKVLGYEIVPILSTQAPAFDPLLDMTVREGFIFDTVKPLTMLSKERVIANIRAVDYVMRYKMPGAIVECGVWRGGSILSMLMAAGEPSRDFWLYDTFSAGMVGRTWRDVDYAGRQNDFLQEPATMAEVQQTLEPWRDRAKSLNFVEGDVRETIPAHVPEEIAILRLDTDFYESTRWELRNLFPRVVPGGLLIIDDYGHWNGVRDAVDEYFDKDYVRDIFLNRIDYSGRLVMKPATRWILTPAPGVQAALITPPRPRGRF